MQLLATVPEAAEVARQYLNRPGHFTDAGEYALDENRDERFLKGRGRMEQRRSPRIGKSQVPQKVR